MKEEIRGVRADTFTYLLKGENLTQIAGHKQIDRIRKLTIGHRATEEGIEFLVPNENREEFLATVQRRKIDLQGEQNEE
jgi:hypothetical protein